MAAIQTGIDRLTVVLSLVEPTPGDKQICADPPELTIFDGESVCWDVRVEEGDRITIEFEEAECGLDRRRGPFEPGSEPSPGVFQRNGPGRMQSGKASCKGRWKYSVTWRSPGWKTNTLDPYVIVRG